MSEMNPYAPPPIIAEPFPSILPTAAGAGVWRSGDQLVMQRGSTLPARCVKTNVPTDHRLVRKLAWSPPWAFLLFGAIGAVLTQKKATIEIGLCEEWQAKRRTRLLIAWGVGILGFVLMFLGIALIDSFEPAIMLVLAMPILLIAGIVIGLTCRIVYPTKIDDRLIWLKGVNRHYLNELPYFPGRR